MTKIAELLRKHLSDSPRGEQSRMVKAMGINKSTMTRWLDGDQVPSGRNSETIVDYIRRVRREKKAGIAMKSTALPHSRTPALPHSRTPAPLTNMSKKLAIAKPSSVATLSLPPTAPPPRKEDIINAMVERARVKHEEEKQKLEAQREAAFAALDTALEKIQ